MTLNGFNGVDCTYCVSATLSYFISENFALRGSYHGWLYGSWWWCLFWGCELWRASLEYVLVRTRSALQQLHVCQVSFVLPTSSCNIPRKIHRCFDWWWWWCCCSLSARRCFQHSAPLKDNCLGEAIAKQRTLPLDFWEDSCGKCIQNKCENNTGHPSRPTPYEMDTSIAYKTP